jgi:enoyl-CoA hydratase
MEAPAPYIHWEISGSIGILTLDSPPGNVIPRPDFLSVDQWRSWVDDPAVRGVIIRGAGRHFSSGADLDVLFSLASNRELLPVSMDAGKALLNAIENINIPVIAEIGGACMGGGLEIALACHLRFCSDQALFAFPEVNQNLIPGLGGTLRLSNLIGKSKSLSALLSGDTFDAATALNIGLADQAWPRKELQEQTFQALQRLISDKPKKVIQHLMQAWHNTRILSYEEAMAEETRLFCELARDEFNRRNQP